MTSFNKINSRGFTLIELIIVIAVIAILAGAIFVAIDPARRLHEARNARRMSDIATILDSVKKYQADNSGVHYSEIDNMTTNLMYLIGTSGGNCANGCAEGTTQAACADLSSIGSNYLAVVPRDPKFGTEEETGYAIIKDANGAIRVLACEPEGEGPGGTGTPPEITISR
jgi:prepilin-type N-terminal cleavage/methylation domain-containing protein